MTNSDSNPALNILTSSQSATTANLVDLSNRRAEMAARLMALDMQIAHAEERLKAYSQAIAVLEAPNHMTVIKELKDIRNQLEDSAWGRDEGIFQLDQLIRTLIGDGR